jgi:putative transposase
MLEYLALLVDLLRATIRRRGDLIAENLLLRQQLAILTRPTRKRASLRPCDKLVWVLARLARRDWRRHLVVVTPEAVVRWHRQGWRLFWRWRSRADRAPARQRRGPDPHRDHRARQPVVGRRTVPR